MKRLAYLGTLLAVGLAVVLASPAWGCSVPVFRYALERWASDRFEVLVFHRGPLSETHQSLVDGFEAAAAEHFANAGVASVDLDADVDPGLLEFYNQQESQPLPRVVVRYPQTAQIQQPAWSGPLNDEAFKNLLDSPRRQEIAGRILQGDSAVWVLLGIGDAERDDAAHATLTEQLERLEKSLKLPEIEQSDLDAGLLSADPEELRLAFSVVRLSRDDAKEAAFVDMLLGTEDDLRNLQEPMAFPIFGRGRVLYALVGRGINPDTIALACSELIGPCTCTVKEENPGVDVVMSVDWDSRVESRIENENVPLTLTGLAGFVAGSPLQAGTPLSDNRKEVVDAQLKVADASDHSNVNEAPPTEADAALDQVSAVNAKPSSTNTGGGILPSMMLVTLLGVGLVVGVSLFVLFKKG